MHPFDQLSLPSGGSFIFTPCPGTKDTSVSEAIATLKAAGTNHIITTLTPEEIEKYQVQSLSTCSAEQAITWHHMPIDDDNIPTPAFEEQFKLALPILKSALENSETITVHCKGGSGRTGLVIALLLRALGWDKEKAKETVQGYRPNTITEPKRVKYYDELIYV